MPANEIALFSAFLAGLFGSGHCVGMCGGIVGALTLGLDARLRRSPGALAPYLLLYNAGRIATYALAGALGGGLSVFVFEWLKPDIASLAARLISGSFMIALGLYLPGWWPGLVVLERVGDRLWRRIEPVGRQFLPVHHPLQAFGAGLVWGWLPCGMVYAALAWATMSGSVLNGALLMTAFGAGTLPMMITAGAVAERLSRIVRRPSARAAMGLLVISFGLYVLLAPGGGHAGHKPSHDNHPPAADTSGIDPIRAV